GFEHAHFSIVHERVSLDELQQVGFDVRADYAVRLDDGAGVGIDVVPRPSDLRLQPAPERTEQIRKSFATRMRTLHAFEPGQKFIRQIGASPVLLRAATLAGPFDDD